MSARSKARAAKASPARRAGPKPPGLPDSPAPSAPPPWGQMMPAYMLQGFAFGLPYPSVLFHCTFPPTAPDERRRLARRFEALFEGAAGAVPLEPLADPTSDTSIRATALWFAALAGRLQRRADLSVAAEPRAIIGNAASVSIAVPTLLSGLEPTGDLLLIACRVFAADSEADTREWRDDAQHAFTGLTRAALTTSNTPRLVTAAVANGIAFQELPGALVQYGIGSRSVQMASTFTRACPYLGARIARVKHRTAAMLLRAGLPAPRNALAADAEHALAIAHELGFPVVVKPDDKDGGLAVQADLRTDEEVRQAFAAASKVSESVLVEAFVPGRDYRITVFHGRAIWAVEREPAGVTGDGRATVRALVAAANADPRRGTAATAALKTIKLDAEAEGLLEREGLTPDSVPPAGLFVRLRRSSNVTSGGMPVAVTERMHPDNARLAERATAVLGLDLAGVDLIIPDIATSWRETGAGICEVNAQPELGGLTAGHLYPAVLKELVGGDGHVPTIAVFGGGEAGDLAARLAATLHQAGVCVGRHDRSGVYVGSELLEPGEIPVLVAGRMLTMDRKVQAIVLGAWDATVLRQGLPVQRIDTLLVTGDTPPRPPRAQGSDERLLTDTLLLLLPHCRSVVALGEADRLDPAVATALRQAGRAVRYVPRAEREGFVAQLLRASVQAVRKAPGRGALRAGP